jgi:hypothetical protein
VASDDVRRLILARRARFIAAAIAGVAACGGQAVIDGEPTDGSGGTAVGGSGGASDGGSGGLPQPCLGTPQTGGGGVGPGPCLSAPQVGGGGAGPCLAPPP